MTERELARGAARRLAIIRHAQEVTGNVSGTSRYYGITRQIYYTWLRRYEEGGLDGIRTCGPPPWQGPSKRSRTSASVHLRKWVRVRAWSRSAAGRGEPARTKQHRARNRARTEKGVVSERASVHHGEPPRGDLEHPPVSPP
jgi:transposase-like protein